VLFAVVSDHPGKKAGVFDGAVHDGHCGRTRATPSNQLRVMQVFFDQQAAHHILDFFA